MGLPLRGRPILLITRMITDRIGLHSVLLPLLITRVISKSDEREARGRFEITSTITPWIVRHEVQLLINHIYNKFQN